MRCDLELRYYIRVSSLLSRIHAAGIKTVDNPPFSDIALESGVRIDVFPGKYNIRIPKAGVSFLVDEIRTNSDTSLKLYVGETNIGGIYQ